MGANVGRPIVTNGWFAAYSCAKVRSGVEHWVGQGNDCDAACSQITLGSLVVVVVIVVAWDWVPLTGL